ncbi:hypothetical protein IW262DRAFT_1406688 [Armillaria fumosa]|nr:hypothetical protein IW262DRAFT_1406688 [Armillaria fumosa]
MSLDVECVLPCEFWPPYKVICHGGTYTELYEAAKDAHDNECLCDLPLTDHAWVPTGKWSHSSAVKSETPPVDSRRVAMDDEVSKSNAEGCATVAWFFDGEDSDGSKGSSSGTLVNAAPTSPSSLATRVGSKYSEDSCSIPSPIKISQGIFKTDCNQSTLPSSLHTAYQDILSSPGVVWVDRTSSLLGLHKQQNFDPGFALVHRPAGFGKTSFLAMAEFFHDVKHRDSPVFRSALSSSWIGGFCAANTHSINLHSDLVLTFDLAATRVSNFETSLVEHVNTVLKEFLHKYQQELQIPPESIASYIYEDGIYSLAGVLSLVRRTGRWRVYLCIDNYNAPSLAAGDTTEINDNLERFLVGPLSSFLRDLRPGLIMGTGDEPDPRMSPYPSRPSVWESIATDLTDHEMLEVAFGFTPEEIHELAREFGVQGVEPGSEARSFGSGLEKVYSMRDVLEDIERQCRERGTEVL